MDDFFDYIFSKDLYKHPNFDDMNLRFLSNEDLMKEYREYFRDRDITKTALTIKMKKEKYLLKRYKIDRTSKTINKKTYRGFEMAKIN
ncbi:MAG: hypothetical protein K9K80_01325 [Spirochaetia bacterium]|nr:hypothetical protein [Spirochaetia bacterium]